MREAASPGCGLGSGKEFHPFQVARWEISGRPPERRARGGKVPLGGLQRPDSPISRWEVKKSKGKKREGSGTSSSARGVRMDGAPPFSFPGPLRVLSYEGHRYLCFCNGGSTTTAPLRLHVTDVCEFWTHDISPEQLDGVFSENGRDLSEDSTSKLREILSRQTPTLIIRDATATVQFQNGRECGLTFNLSKEPPSEAKKQLQDLMFSLVERLQTLEKSYEEGASAVSLLTMSSPEKKTLGSQILFAPGVSPPKSRGCAGQTPTKKRQPGESLINPGFKSKKIPTGVDFEDP